jgi:hypothetical protein
MSDPVIQNELQSIERLFSDFAWFADRCDAEALANLFMPGGVLSVGGRESAGSDNIAADCRKRFAVSDRKTRHMWSACGDADRRHCENHGYPVDIRNLRR